MRYGTGLCYEKAEIQATLAQLRSAPNSLIFTNATVRKLLSDIVTLHDEIEILERELSDSRAEAGRQRSVHRARGGY